MATGIGKKVHSPSRENAHQWARSGNGQNVETWTSYSKVICYENMGEEKEQRFNCQATAEMSENSIMVSFSFNMAHFYWVGLCVKTTLLKRGRFLGIIITNLQKAMCVRVEKFSVVIIWFRNEYWFRTQKTCMFPTLSCWCEVYQIIMGRWLNLMKSREARGFPGGAAGLKKKNTCQCRRYKGFRLDPWVGKVPWRRAW